MKQKKTWDIKKNIFHRFSCLILICGFFSGKSIKCHLKSASTGEKLLSGGYQFLTISVCLGHLRKYHYSSSGVMIFLVFLAALTSSIFIAGLSYLTLFLWKENVWFIAIICFLLSTLGTCLRAHNVSIVIKCVNKHNLCDFAHIHKNIL